MKSSLEKQKKLIVDAVFDLAKRLEALNYLLWKVEEIEKPENRVTFDVYDELLDLLHRLLWDSIVINLYWLYDKKGQRSLFWYLREIKTSNSSSVQKIDDQLKEIENLSDKIEKIKKFRDKWVAHRDKEPFENYDDFWKKEERPKIEEVELLVETASKIIHEHCPVCDLTTHGMQKLFGLIETIVKENPEFLWKMKEFGDIENINYSELHTLSQESKNLES